MFIKKRILLPCLTLWVLFAPAQNITLTDSVIYINEKPVALYYSQLNNTLGRYNIEVKNFSRETLIKAEVIKFNAPVDELQPFYYHEISFTPFNDTVAVYIQDEAFPLVLAKIISTYKLINNNKLDKLAASKLIHYYPGVKAFTAKVIEVEEYLKETRQFGHQTKRDRTAPLKIVNEKTIMQDGVKIGTIIQNEVSVKTNNTLKKGFVKDRVEYRGGLENYTVNRELQVMTASGFIVDLDTYASKFFEPLKSHDKGFILYEASKKKTASGSYTDYILSRVCFLIEEYLL